MSLPAHTQVLVVGAGPTGMACALTLVHLGLHVTLVDAFPDNRNGSRSVVIHAHTLEILDIFGLADPLVKAGIQSRGLTLLRGSKEMFQVDVAQLHNATEFPIILLIAQDEVERILRENLLNAGAEILRPHTVVGIKEADSETGLEVTFDDGSRVLSQYVVGADGSRSTVRRLANIEFKDPATGIDYDAKMPSASTFQVALADVYFSEPLPESVSRNTFCFDIDKFVFVCPLRSGRDVEAKNVSFFRIGVGMAPGGPPLPRNPDIKFLQAQLDNRCPFNAKLKIASVDVATRYRIRTAVADTLFKNIGTGKVLLVGDAAHVHSPAGGQGLNLGLCDAIALGRTIHEHLGLNSNSRSDFLLNEYSISRRKVALRVINMVQRITLLGTATGWRKVIRNAMFWTVGRIPFLSRAIAWRISGLANRD